MRRFPPGFWPCAVGLLLAVGCSGPKSQARPEPPIEHPVVPPVVSVPQPPAVVPVAAFEELPRPPSTVGGPPASYPIDLPTALRLANAQNYQIAFAREQICQAMAGLDRSQTLWLPSLRGGVSYNKHEGRLQDAPGGILETSRDSLYAGSGAGPVGTGSPIVPGVYANFHLADAIFQPLAARQAVAARRWAATATTHEVLLGVSLAYLELLRASVDVVIARDAREDARALADLTAAYARSGQGLPSDADRARTEWAIRQTDAVRSEEAFRVASARLAQLLRLDPRLPLVPLEPAMEPIILVPGQAPVGELVAQGLSARPELAESKHLVAQAVERMRRQQFSPLVPSIVLGASYGTFGGGRGDTLDAFGDRVDVDAMAFWELRGLGLGDRAADAETRSLVRQANINRLATMDRVAREVTEADAQVRARGQEIELARQGVAAAIASQQRNGQRIQAGQGLPIEALQSNQALAQARREYLRTITDYNVAQFTLYRAVGWPGGDRR